jgi:hypothetical protein
VVEGGVSTRVYDVLRCGVYGTFAKAYPEINKVKGAAGLCNCVEGKG